jgi:hypothetical protein
MRISPTTNLSEPAGAERVSEGTLAYFRARNRRRLYQLVVDEFERSGLSQADLARRLGKGTDLVCRWLGSPGNWTADTVSDLLFATSSAEPTYSLRYPLASSAATPKLSDSSTAGGEGAKTIGGAAQSTTSNVSATSSVIVPLISPEIDRHPIEVEPYVTPLEELEAA